MPDYSLEWFRNESELSLCRIRLNWFDLSMIFQDSVLERTVRDSSPHMVDPDPSPASFFPTYISKYATSDSVHLCAWPYSTAGRPRRTTSVLSQGLSVVPSRLARFLLLGGPSRHLPGKRLHSPRSVEGIPRKWWTYLCYTARIVQATGNWPVNSNLELLVVPIFLYPVDEFRWSLISRSCSTKRRWFTQWNPLDKCGMTMSKWNFSLYLSFTSPWPQCFFCGFECELRMNEKLDTVTAIAI